MVSVQRGFKIKSDYIKLIPLGGLGEIGKNMMAIEIDGDIIIIDCGIMFPDIDMFGVDLVIPDMKYVFENKKRVKAVLLTHGHEDHIGALPYFLREVNVPVYGSRLTIELVKARLDETMDVKDFKLFATPPRTRLKLGGISFEFLRTNHSIADSYAIVLYTRIGIIVHTGDFKIDLTPVDGKFFDFYKFATLGENGVLALLSDSTNVEREGYTRSEMEIGLNLRRTIEDAKGRIIVATFSSNIHRIQQLLRIAKTLDKKIAASGRNMIKNIEIASEIGHISLSKKHFIELEDLDKYKKEDTIVITTGSQGEPMSALSLIARGSHRYIKAEKDDTVIISASVVPGNEKTVSKVIDSLFKIGVHVIYEGFDDIHVSGHGSRDELKLMLALVRPKFFVPVHGNFRHLVHHATIAEQMGINPDHIVIAQDGDILELNNSEIKKSGSIDVDTVFVDGKIVGDVSTRVMYDRQTMSGDGILFVILPYNKKEQKLGKPDIITRGFIYVKESKDMLGRASRLIEDLSKEYLSKNKIATDDFGSFKNYLKIELKKFLYNETARKPMIIVRVIFT